MSFAATPSVGNRAWAIRLRRAGYAAAGTLEILQLRRQSDCNRYDIETKWQAPLSDAQYRSLTDRIAPFASVSSAELSELGASKGHDIVLDGTAIVLEIKSSGWEVTRRLNHYGHGGAELSAIFHKIVSEHAPDEEIPSADWRPR